jgi:predicted aconitase with swiveling domain
MKLKVHTINPGQAEGEAIVTSIPFSFLGELDPATGTVPSPSHELFGQSLAGKIFIFPTGKGSSTGPMIAWYAMIAGNLPGAMICVQAEPVVASAAITANIPMVDRLNKNPLEVIKTGDHVKVDATNGIVEIMGK